MSIEVSLAEAKNHLSELIRQVEAGEQVVITKHHKPAARLLSEADYERWEKRLAVAGLRTMRERFKEAGLTARELHQASRRRLEDQAERVNKKGKTRK